MTAKNRLLICLTVTLILAVLLGVMGCQRVAVYNVALNETYLEMQIGDTETLVATVDTEVPVTVTWTSSHTDVATVEDGVVTAVGAGTASIKASAKDKVAVCTVVVNYETQSQVVATIILDCEEMSIYVGEDFTLTAITLPDKLGARGLVWKSSNTDVASVYDGHVIANGVGTTIISASKGTVAAICRVEVKSDYRHTFPNGPLNFATFSYANGMVMGNVMESPPCTFSFEKEIACAPNATYEVYKDSECREVVANKTVTLQNGTNTFYIIAIQDYIRTRYRFVINQIPTFSVTLKVDGCGDATVYFRVQNNSDIGSVIPIQPFEPGDKECRYPAEQNVMIGVSGITSGYIFDGWYDGETLVSSNAAYGFTMPTHDVTYTARIALDERIANLDFELTKEGFVIMGFKEGADTSELVIPEYTARIKNKAFMSARIDKVTWLATDCQGVSTMFNETKSPFYLSNIDNLYIDKSVTKISDNIFYDAFIGNTYYNGSIADWCKIDFGDNATPIKNKWYIDGELVKDVVIPEGITEIKARAFYCSNIESITFPDSLQTIGERAFGLCRNLKEINWSNGLKTIGRSAFLYCNLTAHLTLPNTVETIGESAFANTQITSITIPMRVKTIASHAFSNAPIDEVYYLGTAERWNNISVAYPNYEIHHIIYFYSESEPALNDEGTAYVGNYWHYVDDVVTVWRKETE